MANEPSRVVLKLNPDLRLVTGVAGAVGHFAEQAGLDAHAQAGLIAATEEACRDAIPLLAATNAALGVTIERFPDRLEVTLEHTGQTMPPGNRGTPGIPDGEGAVGAGPGRRLRARVDRVQVNIQGGASRMTLVKYLRGHPRGK